VRILRLSCTGLVLLALACTADTLVSVGRPCAVDRPCGPDASCDLTRGVCVAGAAPDLAADRPIVLDRSTPEQPPASDRGLDGSRPDLPTAPCVGKNKGDSCDDGAYCTVGETCQNGVCVGTPRSCPSTSLCTKASCDEATDTCVSSNRVNGSPCASGQCYDGACCEGCWTGASCVTGTKSAACGEAGALCQDCTSSQCRTVSGTTCDFLFSGCGGYFTKPDGTSCAGGAGQCREGGCCTGCWDEGDDRCQVGTYSKACGKLGALCADCSSECLTSSFCSSGACAPAKPDGTNCTNGTCHKGVCCTGCIDSGTCYVNNASHCGTPGGSCTTCPAATAVCKTATCTNGVCGIGNVTDGKTCDTTGACRSGVCCLGCWSGSACRSGAEDAYCGMNGGLCSNCATLGKTCVVNTCQ
jgi:hypothetical protein